MNWTNHPYLYQVLHPWHWLTYGQNSNGVSTVAALCATVAATIAGIYAVKTYRSTFEQLQIAKLQFETSNQQHREANTPFISVNAVLAMDKNGRVRIEVTNQGQGRAVNVQGDLPSRFVCPSLIHGATVTAIVELAPPPHPDDFCTNKTFEINYESVDGRKFVTVFWATPYAMRPIQHVRPR